MKYPEEVAGTAAQIVFEYPNWSDEHISDMFDAVVASEGRPKGWDEDTLQDATYEAHQLKEEGLSYDEVVNKLTEGE